MKKLCFLFAYVLKKNSVSAVENYLVGFLKKIFPKNTHTHKGN